MSDTSEGQGIGWLFIFLGIFFLVVGLCSSTGGWIISAALSVVAGVILEVKRRADANRKKS